MPLQQKDLFLTMMAQRRLFSLSLKTGRCITDNAYLSVRVHDLQLCYASYRPDYQFGR
jgi:hypothetical protein